MKRKCSRGITFIDDNILLIERHKLVNNKYLDYYTIPGGGIENDETAIEAAIRETREETCVETKLVKYLGQEEYDKEIIEWHLLEYISGKPTLGGEEKKRNSKDNSYKVVLININSIDSINILGRGREFIKLSLKEYIWK